MEGELCLELVVMELVLVLLSLLQDRMLLLMVPGLNNQVLHEMMLEVLLLPVVWFWPLHGQIDG